MQGTPQKIDIAEKLIWKIAKADFGVCNGGDDLCEQNEYVKGMWHDGTVKYLDDFNYLTELFDEQKIQCTVEVCGCGHDVDELYAE